MANDWYLYLMILFPKVTFLDMDFSLKGNKSTTPFRISYKSNLLYKYENTFKGCVDMLEYIALEMLVVEHNI